MPAGKWTEMENVVIRIRNRKRGMIFMDGDRDEDKRAELKRGGWVEVQ